MKKFIITLFSIITTLIWAQKKDIQHYIDNAPFEFGKMVLPTIPEKSYNILDFGAIGDGKTLNTKAFAKAIQTISKNGGGQLIVPKGIYLTGPIEIKSKIDFHTEEGAIIQFSSDINEYPLREYSKGKFDVTPPIWGDNLTDVAFTGKGIFDGAGEAWRPIKKFKLSETAWQNLLASGGTLSADGKVWWPSQMARDGETLHRFISKNPNATIEDYKPLHHFLRPMMFTLSKVKNLLIDGPTFRNSPKFVINPKQIENLVIRNTTVYNPKWAQNGDGIDISASKNVIIYNCNVTAGDDGICMKSSGETKDKSARLQNIIIAECTVNEAHGGFVIGSNTDGGMKNIYVTNSTFNGSDIGIRVKSNSGRGGDVSNIYIDNIIMKNIVKSAILFDTFYADAPVGSTKEDQEAQHTGQKNPYFHNFYISNITCNSAETGFFFRGLKDIPVENIFFKNIQFDNIKTPIFAEHIANIVFENVTFNGKKNFKIDKKNMPFVIFK